MVQTWNVGDTILDLYRVTDILGEGGFGKVYKVRHQRWNLDLAMKIPRPDIVAAAGGIEGFEQEAETWVNLGLHPHTVSCYYVRRLDHNPLVFAEYVAGGSLHDWIRGRKLYEGDREASLQRILDIAIQFAWGLDFSHEQGLIHQDVKPENVMMTPSGVVKVTDFGLAKGRVLVDAVKTLADGTVVTEAGAMTPAYCSPEQAGKQTLTRRTDLWSWAVSVLEMFVGERSWQSGSIAGYCLKNYLQQEPEDSTLPQMPTKVAELLSHCFQENPSERPRTMVDVANQLQEIYQQVTGAAYPRTIARAAEDIADSLNSRAVSLLDLGKREEAMQLWERSLQVQPQHPESTYNQGLLLWRGCEIDDLALLKKLEEVKNSHPEDWQVDYFISLVHLERDDCEAAIEILENIGEEGKGQEEIQKALVLAKERLPNSSRLLRTFAGHTYIVSSVCMSADGRYALSGSWDNTLKLWDVETGDCLRTFRGHRGRVESVCMSADGSYALSSSEDKTLKLWNLETGECLRTFSGYTNKYRASVTSACMSQDGCYALFASGDRTLKLWDLETGECLRTFPEHDYGVDSVCMSQDGCYALSASGGRTLKLWDLETGECLRTFPEHNGGVDSVCMREPNVTSVCMSADGSYALSGSEDETLKLWNLETGECLRAFSGCTVKVSGYYSSTRLVSCMNADGRLALSGSEDKTFNLLPPMIDYGGKSLLSDSEDGTLKLWNLETGQCLRTFPGHTDVYSVCMSQDGRYALSGSVDKTLKLWSVSSSSSFYLAPTILSEVVATEQVISIELTYQQELALAQKAVAQKDYVTAAQHIREARSQPKCNRRMEALNLWTSLYVHLPRQKLLSTWESRVLEGHTDPVTSVCMSSDGRLALSGSLDNTLKFWDIATGKCLRTFQGHTRHGVFRVQGVYSVCMSQDGRLALSGSLDNTLKLWDVETGQYLRTFEGHTFFHRGSVDSVCMSADGSYALSSGEDGTLKLWNTETGQYLRTLQGHTNHVTSVCLSADGHCALSGSWDGPLKFWDIETGDYLRTFQGHRGRVSSVCMSADGRYALSGSWDGTLKFWDIETGQCLRTLQGHRGRVDSVCLSADGHCAFSASGDNTLKLWEIETGQCLRTLQGHTSHVNSVCLSTDGRFALSGSHDKTIKLWFLDWDLELKQTADWDEGARPYLDIFIQQQTPYAATLPTYRKPTIAEITLALTRRGTPTWTETDFQKLLYTLGCAGYGWLRPEGVRQQLEAMASETPRHSSHS
jgi:WD40 repeat protein/serine/threonine protein kinase